MATDDLIRRDGPVTGNAHVFSVRLWKEALAAGSEYRGSVREVRSNAYRGFRDWSELVAFMVARIEQEERDGQHRDGAGGG